jgi:hypothetical protein
MINPNYLFKKTKKADEERYDLLQTLLMSSNIYDLDSEDGGSDFVKHIKKCVI